MNTPSFKIAPHRISALRGLVNGALSVFEDSMQVPGVDRNALALARHTLGEVIDQHNHPDENEWRESLYRVMRGIPEVLEGCAAVYESWGLSPHSTSYMRLLAGMIRERVIEQDAMEALEMMGTLRKIVTAGALRRCAANPYACLDTLKAIDALVNGDNPYRHDGGGAAAASATVPPQSE